MFLKVPGKKLTTYIASGDKYSVIQEYVGGDAYNFIIGASLVGGEIAGVKAQKAIFISVGALITCFGLYAFSCSKDDNINVRLSTTSSENEYNKSNTI